MQKYAFVVFTFSNYQAFASVFPDELINFMY